MASKIKVDQLETADGTGTIALQNQLSGMTTASLPTSSVLQIVQSGSISRTTISSTGSWVTHDGTTITPSSTSSKILILFSQPVHINGNSSNLMRGGVRLQRGTTTMWNTNDFDEMFHNRNADNEMTQMINGQYLDSPNTTSATTYNLQGNLKNGTSLIMFENGHGTTMTLIEIKG